MRSGRVPWITVVASHRGRGVPSPSSDQERRRPRLRRGDLGCAPKFISEEQFGRGGVARGPPTRSFAAADERAEHREDQIELVENHSTCIFFLSSNDGEAGR